MKNQALFPSKDKSKQLKCSLLQFLFGALRVNSTILRALDKKEYLMIIRDNCLVLHRNML